MLPDYVLTSWNIATTPMAELLSSCPGGISIGNFPTELLCEIFAHCLPTPRADANSSTFDSLSVSQGPWLLARVCSRWRKIVTGMPEFWALISPGSRTGNLVANNLSLNHTIALLAEQLSLSQNSPLIVCLSVPSRNHSLLDEDRHLDNRFLRRVLEVITPHAYRWREFSAFLSSPSHVAHFNSLRSLPVLETLLINLSGDSHDMSQLLDIDPMDIQMFQDTPRLNTIALYINPYSPVVCSLSWSQLTTFEGDFCMAEHLHVLQHTPFLQTCRITISSYFSRPSIAVLSADHPVLLERVSLPFLQSLHITVTSGAKMELPAFIDCLILPTLSSFEIVFDRGYPFEFPSNVEWFWQGLVDVLQRSQCPLRTLSLPGYMKWSQDQLCRVLEQTPLLEILEVTVTTFNDMDRLTYCPESGQLPLIPRLKALSLSVLGDINTEQVADMFASRWWLADGRVRQLEQCFLLVSLYGYKPTKKGSSVMGRLKESGFSLIYRVYMSR